MKYLLDTHALIWFYQASTTSAANIIYVSPASYWEIAIKLSNGSALFTESFTDFIQHSIFDNGFRFLPIEPQHCEPLLTLPFNHKDPFDRMIISQAMIEQIPILGVDKIFDQYPIQRIW